MSMGDPQPPPMHPSRSNMSMLYYGLIVIGTATIVLAIYHLLLEFCADFTDFLPQQRTGVLSWRRLQTSVSSSKYKKGSTAHDEGGDSECAVGLSVFGDGEELWQLPKCKHSFYAPCEVQS